MILTDQHPNCCETRKEMINAEAEITAHLERRVRYSG